MFDWVRFASIVGGRAGLPTSHQIWQCREFGLIGEHRGSVHVSRSQGEFDDGLFDGRAAAEADGERQLVECVSQSVLLGNRVGAR